MSGQTPRSGWRGPTGPIPIRAELGLSAPDPSAPIGLLSSILNSTADGLLVVDRNGRILAWNGVFVAISGLPLEILEAGEEDAAIAFVAQRLNDPEAFVSRIRRLRAQPAEESFDTIHLKDGRILERVSRPLGGSDDIQGRVWSFRDITDREHAARSLRESEMRFRAFAEGAACGLLIYRGEEIVFANRWAHEVFGEIVGRSFLTNVHPEDVELVRSRAAARARREEIPKRYDVRLIDKEGLTRWFEVTADAIELEARPAVLVTAYEITNRKEAEDRTRHVAFHDALTSLPNRALFVDRAQAALALAHRDSGTVGVILLDIDRFKHVNDSLGHDAGDQLISRVAERMREVLRGSDTVGRLGGDEFAVLLPGLRAEEVVKVARKLCEAMRRPFLVGGRELRTTASLGLAVGPQDGADFQTLLKSADTAMYRAKDAGRDRFQLFDPAMNITAIRLLEMENELHEGLAQNQFVLFYQPIIAARTNEPLSVEALLRWRRPDGALWEPESFIEVAESTGLIQSLGRFVLHQACRDLAEMRAALDIPLRLSINASAAQLRETSLVDLVSEALSAAGLAAEAIEIEVAESAALQAQEKTLDALRALGASGVAVTLDDFGVGRASLDLLRRLPIRRIKIDPSFVRDLGDDKVDEAIASSTIALAHRLGLEVVGEGVETELQRDFLVTQGCDLLQGNLLGRPAPLDETIRMLRARISTKPQGAS